MPTVDPLKYQPVAADRRDAGASDELFTVKLRYKEPEGDRSRLLERAVRDEGRDYGEASEDYRFASAVAAFGMLLRGSPHRGNASYPAVLELAEASVGADPMGYRREFVELVRKAQSLAPAR